MPSFPNLCLQETWVQSPTGTQRAQRPSMGQGSPAGKLLGYYPVKYSWARYVKNKVCLLEPQLPSKLLTQDLNSAPRGLWSTGVGEVNKGTPLWGHGVRKTEAKIQEIWELNIQSLTWGLREGSDQKPRASTRTRRSCSPRLSCCR